MINDLDLATLCWSCYHDVDTFDRVIEFDGVWAGIKHFKDDVSVIALRGSTTFQDWLRDFQTLMVNDPCIGFVEQGFMRGMRDMMVHVADEIDQPQPKVYITGHSLGAARALILAALIAEHGYASAIQAVVTFGSPRPGGHKIKELLAPLTLRSYRNGNDPVCEVPFHLELLPYVHPREFIMVDVPAKPDDPWGLLSRHHSELYMEAMKKLWPEA